jgi:hypothetical protein
MKGVWRVDDPNEGEAHYERFGGVEVFRPGWTATIALRNEAEAHFRAKFKPGTYVGRDAVNNTLQHHFAFYAQKLGQILPGIASRDYLEFVLFQYERSSVVESLEKKGQLKEHEEGSWQKTGPALRRALKYLAERTVLLSPQESPKEKKPPHMLRQAEQALLCAEQLVQLYMESDKVFSLFPDTTTVEVLPEGELEIFRTHWEDDFSSEIVLRMKRDTKNRAKFIQPIPPQMLPAGQDTNLADVFRQTIGVTLQQALGVIRAVVDHTQKPPTPMGIPFCSREMIVREITRYSGFPREGVEKALNGFTVTRPGMQSEGREVFKPKQEHRAYRRGFFEMPHTTGPHLAWSQQMAIENAVALITDLPMKQVPVEWKSPAVESALGRLSNGVGRWFQTSVARNFKELGFVGIDSAKGTIDHGPTALSIPPNVGEIDFLGHSPADKAVIVAECKYVRGGAEPKFYRDDLTEFVTSTNAFMKRLERKAEWIVQNLFRVRQALSAATGSPISEDTRRVFSVMVTYYPSCAAHFWKRAPCVSLAEFMLDYQFEGRWPYKTGKYVLD